MPNSTHESPAIDLFDAEQLQLLYRYCYALTANEQDAYDLLHDALERFLRSAQQASVGLAYLKQIIRNRFIDQYRKQQRHPETSLDVIGINPPDLNAINVENLIEVEQLWQQLEPTDRDILYHWAYEDLSAREVAELLNMPRGTVLSRMHRIRQKLVKFTAKVS